MTTVNKSFHPSVRTLVWISAGDMYRRNKGTTDYTFITIQQKPGDVLDISPTLVVETVGSRLDISAFKFQLYH